MEQDTNNIRPENENNAQDDQTTSKMGTGIALGIAIGAGIGVAMDNIAIGVAIGIAIGTAIGASWDQSDRNQ